MSENNQKLIAAARKGEIDTENGARHLIGEIIKLQSVEELNWSEKPFYRSALWTATSWGHEHIVKLMLDKGFDVDSEDYQGWTPLHEAAKFGHTGICRMLLEKGADINKRDQFGQSPIFKAVNSNQVGIVNLFLTNGADPNIADGKGLTIMHFAMFNGQKQDAWALYQAGAWINRFAVDETVDETVVEEKPKKSKTDELIDRLVEEKMAESIAVA